MTGDPGGNRTRGHLIKSQVLYQLSYRISRAFYFIRYDLSLQELHPLVAGIECVLVPYASKNPIEAAMPR